MLITYRINNSYLSHRIMDKAARLTKIKKTAELFKQKHAQIVGEKVKVVEVGPRDGLQN